MKKKDTVLGRWVEAVLSAYPEDSAALFQKQRDPFANPLGHSVRKGTSGLLECILHGMDPEEIRKHLDEIVRIRAVQQLAPSQALSFLFSLKPLLREALSELPPGAQVSAELAELDARIDRVALMAFDLYTECREEVGQLRINEVKRQMGWVLEKMNQRDETAGDAPAGLG
ncbi:RsbRD N-terminal domain-containing protein [Gemmatimonadota bacterium]